jgi:hypothetical protein
LIIICLSINFKHNVNKLKTFCKSPECRLMIYKYKIKNINEHVHFFIELERERVIFVHTERKQVQ